MANKLINTYQNVPYLELRYIEIISAEKLKTPMQNNGPSFFDIFCYD